MPHQCKQMTCRWWGRRFRLRTGSCTNLPLCGHRGCSRFRVRGEYKLTGSDLQRAMTGSKNHPRGMVGRTPWSRSRHNDISILRGASRPTGASAADQGVRPTNPGGPVFHGISRAEGPFKQARRPVLHSSKEACIWRFMVYLAQIRAVESVFDGEAGIQGRMCGIAGFTRRNKGGCKGVAERITEAISHRGPDQQGIFEGSEATLCAVRLKIIDLEGGNQPILSDDRDTAIVFNGEIYNHREIRGELEGLGHHFRSNCDTETVLRAYLEWDTACFSRMRGMFAVALWTESEKRLVLVRDRMGIKPLYYYRRGEELYFGSELKAILEHPEVPRELDLDALDTYLSLNYVAGTQTLIRGIRKVAPGHLLEWRQGKVHSEAWGKSPEGAKRRISLGAAKEELDWLLRDAVQEHLIADVPLGVWASGGLDSSAILHYAAAQTAGKLKTFSVSFRGRSFDESRYFREMARNYGTDHHEFDLNPEVELQSAIEDFAYYSDEPSADAGALPVWFLSRKYRHHVTVACQLSEGPPAPD